MWAHWHFSVILPTQEAEAGGLRTQGLPGLQPEFKFILKTLVRPCLKVNNTHWGGQ